MSTTRKNYFLQGISGQPNPVDSVRIAEPDSEGEGDSDSTTRWQAFKEEPNATGFLAKAYQRIHQLNMLAYRRLVTLPAAQREVRMTKMVLKRSEKQC